MCEAISMTMTEVSNMSESEYNELYKENEHYNCHIENLVLEAKRFGSTFLVARCESFYYKYIRKGYIDWDLRDENVNLYMEIKKAKNKKVLDIV